MNGWADRISDLSGQRLLNEIDTSHSLINRLIDSWELLLRTYQKTSNTYVRNVETPVVSFIPYLQENCLFILAYAITDMSEDLGNDYLCTR